MAVQIQLRRDLAADWTSVDPILAEGEIGLEIDVYPPAWKVGDGVNTWSALSYQAAGLADGSYGDITVSGSGTVLTIANNAVTTAKIIDDAVTLGKIADQADQTILGNNSGGSASPTALTVAQAQTLLNLGAWISGAASKATPVDGDSLPLSDSAASSALKSLTWANLKATLKTYFDTLYAAMPFTIARFTLQTSVPSAASSGEAKVSVRDMAGLGILSLRSLSGHYLVFPEFTDPMVRGSWISSGSTRATKGIPSGFANAGTVSGAQLTGLEFANLASAATTNSTAQTSNNNQYSVTSGGTYNGYHCWTTVQLPDASYGSGATGVSIFVGLCSASNLATVLTSDRILTSQVAAGFSFDTTLSDTNWKFTVRSGSSTNITTTDTGIAFATGKHWLFMWYAPSGGSDTFWFIANITDGTSASGTTARQHGSVGAGEVVGLVTRDNVARNVRIGDYWVRHGASY